MEWLQSLDIAIFNFLNQTAANGILDWLLEPLSWNIFFVPAVVALGIVLLWKGGTRGRLFVLLSLLVLLVGDGLISSSLKEVIRRTRPYEMIPSTRVLVGRGLSGSMPSAHAANWFALTLVAFVFYRRSIRLMLPLAVAVGFSRIYLGAHFLSDVLVGAILGVAYAWAIVWGSNQLWILVSRRWFPVWHRSMPSFLKLDSLPTTAGEAARPSLLADNDPHWLRLGYLMIVLLLFVRLLYIAGGVIELSEDEAYQWLWSKHLALSYFSKPPLIAYTQFLGTGIWGDSEFGVRFFSPVIAALLSVMILRFAAREINARAGFWLLAVITATPLLAVGGVLMTIDSLSVLFWTAAMISGWEAVQRDRARSWLLTGLWIGLGFLSKYMAPFQMLCWTVFFCLWKPARGLLRRPGPYWALLVAALCAIPVILWNYQHDWITVTHLRDRGGLDETWRITTRFLLDFTLAAFGLLNPVFFVGMLVASIAIWHRRKPSQFEVFCFSMGAPLFLVYWAYTLRSRVHPNWIVPAVLPLACLMVAYWDGRWREGLHSLSKWMTLGILLGLAVIVPLHNTDLVHKLSGSFLPVGKDPNRRVKGGRETARVVQSEYEKLLAENRPAFVIASHYGLTSLLSFYWPEAKARILEEPLVFCQSSDAPVNQFYFWPGYPALAGSNGLFVREIEEPMPPPERLANEFSSVTDLGVREIIVRGRVLRRIQLFKCENLL